MIFFSFPYYQLLPCSGQASVFSDLFSANFGGQTFSGAKDQKAYNYLNKKNGAVTALQNEA
jgi:hypothetical protein